MRLLFFAYVRPTPQEPLSRAPLLYKQTLEHADGRQAKVSCIRIGVCALVVATVVHNAPVTIVVTKTGVIFQDESSIVIPQTSVIILSTQPATFTDWQMSLALCMLSLSLCGTHMLIDLVLSIRTCYVTYCMYVVFCKMYSEY